MFSCNYKYLFSLKSQVASSSLDAGAKIYAGRVDAVHQETYKVLGGLGRSQPENNDGQPEARDDAVGDDDGQSPAAAAAEKKRLRAEKRRKKNVIQKNLSKIRIRTFDLKVSNLKLLKLRKIK